MLGMYLKAGAGVAVVALAYGLWIGGVHYERNRAATATAQARIETILNTKGARDAAANLDDDSLIDTLGRWLLPSP
jgi:hypothetical protein